mmetsp:Transcript_7048/g.18886  ORF Transcript_7048/g.18886 Transcript_7048/m.18886 type:complete len:243 (-) Transcript_7048:782-1510(-)
MSAAAGGGGGGGTGAGAGAGEERHGLSRMFPKTLSGKLTRSHRSDEHDEEDGGFFPRNITMRAKERVENVMSEVKEDKPHATPPPVEKVVKTDDEWRALLPADVYEVTRVGKLDSPKLKLGTRFKPEEHGIFICRCCNEPLFAMAAQAPSMTGHLTFSQSLPSRTKRAETSGEFEKLRLTHNVYCERCGAFVGVVGIRKDAPDAHKKVTQPMQVSSTALIFLEAKIPKNSKRSSTRIGFTTE